MLHGVLAAIQFHNQSSLYAHKIDNVTPDRVLPSKLHAEATIPQSVPQHPFNAGQFVPKALRPLGRFFFPFHASA